MRASSGLCITETSVPSTVSAHNKPVQNPPGNIMKQIKKYGNKQEQYEKISEEKMREDEGRL